MTFPGEASDQTPAGGVMVPRLGVAVQTDRNLMPTVEMETKVHVAATFWAQSAQNTGPAGGHRLGRTVKK